ncbi:MAG: TadE/TadG family type IV pilus assembly protein [Eubacterium sp.]
MFWKKIKKEEGQAMVEFAMVLPIFLLVLCGIIDFGWLFFNQLSLNNACREAARVSVVEEESNREDVARNKIIDYMASMGYDEEDIDVDVTTTSEGNVVVEAEADMVILTPVLGAFYDNQIYPMKASVTMKSEI